MDILISEHHYYENDEVVYHTSITGTISSMVTWRKNAKPMVIPAPLQFGRIIDSANFLDLNVDENQYKELVEEWFAIQQEARIKEAKPWKPGLWLENPTNHFINFVTHGNNPQKNY